MDLLIVFLGAGVGGALRHGVNLAAARLDLSFPFETLAINVIGSFAMDIIVEYFAPKGTLPQGRRLS